MPVDSRTMPFCPDIIVSVTRSGPAPLDIVPQPANKRPDSMHASAATRVWIRMLFPPQTPHGNLQPAQNNTATDPEYRDRRSMAASNWRTYFGSRPQANIALLKAWMAGGYQP